jgi:hypothetical protein
MEGKIKVEIIYYLNDIIMDCIVLLVVILRERRLLWDNATTPDYPLLSTTTIP